MYENISFISSDSLFKEARVKQGMFFSINELQEQVRQYL